MTNMTNQHQVDRKNKKHQDQVDMKPYKINSRFKQTWQIKTRWIGWMRHTNTRCMWTKLKNQHHVERRNLKHQHQMDRKQMKTEYQVYRKPCDKSTPGEQENCKTSTSGVQDKSENQHKVDMRNLKISTRWTGTLWTSNPKWTGQIRNINTRPRCKHKKENNTRWSGRTWKINRRWTGRI